MHIKEDHVISWLERRSKLFQHHNVNALPFDRLVDMPLMLSILTADSGSLCVGFGRLKVIKVANCSSIVAYEDWEASRVTSSDR